MITLEIDRNQIDDLTTAELNLCIDEDGARKLIEAITKLLATSQNDHIHFMAKSWGVGEYDISENAVGKDTVILNQMTLRYYATK